MKFRHQYRLQIATPLQPVAVDPATLGGTIAGLARAAAAAGFRTDCWAGYGVRIPKIPSQAYRWQAWTALYGSDGATLFEARNDDEGWTVILHRSGWPVSMTTTTGLRALFAARTPAVMR